MDIYTNDEETRTFISIRVASGEDQLLSMVHRLNSLLSNYKLPAFYEVRMNAFVSVVGVKRTVSCIVSATELIFVLA